MAGVYTVQGYAVAVPHIVFCSPVWRSEEPDDVLRIPAVAGGGAAVYVMEIKLIGVEKKIRLVFPDRLLGEAARLGIVKAMNLYYEEVCKGNKKKGSPSLVRERERKVEVE